MAEPDSRGWRLAWWLVPILVWNLALTPFLPDGYADDEGVPAALLWFENAARIGVFGWAVFLRERAVPRRGARIAVIVGMAVYFGSWGPLLVWPETASHLVIALGPAVTPVLWFAALAWLGRAPAWFVATLVFLAAHVSHQILAG